eukprot:NODE_505_length_7533_cov_0.471886.p1 type:complete len:501 gc:universal NODE_505_length_7533_cov_0.471886:1986-484(-)
MHSKRTLITIKRRSSSFSRALGYAVNEPQVLKGKTGGEIVHEMLRVHNVKKVFGYSGGAILPVFDAIYNSPYFSFYMPRNEQGGGFNAIGYARSMGNKQPGVVIVTSGPGATNLVTPLQDAFSDGIPLVCLTGQVPTTAIGSDAFQEADIIGITRSCTKWNCMVKSIEELPLRINEAFHIAMSGRKGPVLVDLPKDITASVLNKPVSLITPKFPGLKSLDVGHFNDLKLSKIADMLNKAQKPVIYAGHGILHSKNGAEMLTKLSVKCQIPVTTTLLGMGSYDEMSELSLHMLGMHGSAYANFSMQNADVILAMGARFDDRVTGNPNKFAPEARRAARENRGGIFHFDILPKNINKVIQVDEAIEGDVGSNIKTLLPMLQTVKRSDRAPWINKINSWKARYPFFYKADDSIIKPQQAVQALNDEVAHMKENVIITTGVGQHQMFAAQHYRWRYPNTFITSGGLGTMGFGLPAAIGAKIGQPSKIVVDIDGDASFAMSGIFI